MACSETHLAWRARARAAGRCNTCCCREPVPGGKYCQQCLDYRASYADKQREAAKAWKVRNREAVRASNAARYWSDIDKSRAIGAARYHANRDAERARRQVWVENNRDAVRHRNRLRGIATRGAVGSFTRAEWSAIVGRQRGKCAICQTRTNLTRDHIVPILLGGCNFAYNIQGLCRPCNSRKNAKLLPGVTFSLFDRIAVL